MATLRALAHTSADSSTFPTGIGGNPMLTVMAVARLNPPATWTARFRVSRTVLAEGSPA